MARNSNNDTATASDIALQNLDALDGNGTESTIAGTQDEQPVPDKSFYEIEKAKPGRFIKNGNLVNTKGEVICPVPEKSDSSK